jgi:hypothetical protein
MPVCPTYKLDSGQEIHLDCLFQYPTYGGMLEGLPTRRKNARLVQRALEYAAEKLWDGGTPHLLVPRETKLDISRERWPIPHEDCEPVRIPPVTCLATFASLTWARDPDADCSSLRVVWFQDAFGPPADREVLRQLRAIDWPALATDGGW